MEEPLQDFGFKVSQYERPGCGWVCGRTAQGEPCSIGPNRKGNCGTVTTCRPELVGDRYECTRIAPQGGTCEDGPRPDGSCCQPDESCQPRRSLMSRRRQVAIWVSVLTFGFCMWIFGSESPTDAISPGELTFQHRSSVTVGTTNCSTCHSAADGGFDNWLKCAFDSQTAIADSQKCLKCHDELGEDAFAAHGLSRVRLVSLTERTDDDSGLSVPLRLRLAKFSKMGATDHQNRKLACATCHHEHRGKGFDLKTMSNDQCSTCHKKQFRDFGHGHPEFTDFPYSRRSRIYFDHARHMQKYFPETADHKKRDCSTCHSPDRTGSQMRTHSFKRTCASCHESQIVDRDFRGVAFLQLPMINHVAIDKHNVLVGEWPSGGTGKQTAQLPPLMKMLLRSDAEYQQAMLVLGSWDLRDLDPSETSQQKAISQLLWAIKELFYDVATGGESAIRKRLGPRADLILALKPSIVPSIKTAQQRWFPQLADELKQRVGGNLKAIKNTPVSSTVIPSVTAKPDRGGGWYVRDGDLSIRYRPVGHSDPVLRALLDAGATDWRAKRNHGPRTDDFENLFRTLANPTASGGTGTNGPVASGRCLSCHSIDIGSNGRPRINWNSGSTRSTHRKLTKFSHAPHVKTLGSTGCAKCHSFETDAPDKMYRPEFFVFEPRSKSWMFETDCKSPCTSGFEPTQRATCVKCHTGQAVGDNCLKCHNYHGHQLSR